MSNVGLLILYFSCLKIIVVFVHNLKKKRLIMLILMVKLASFIKILLLIVVNKVVNFNEISLKEV